MFNFFRRRCFQAALQVQRVPVNMLCSLRSPIVSPSHEACLQGSLFRCLRPLLAHPGQLHMFQKLHTSPYYFKKIRIPEEPPPRELDLLRYDMKSLKDGPKPALYLCAAGLIPFISVPFIMGATEVYYPELAFAQLAYSASILSFVGGARWGFAIPDESPARVDWMNLTNSAVPALMAWAALILRDNLTVAYIMVIMGFGIALHNDLSLLPTYPPWLKALWAILTLVAVSSLIATLLAASSYPEKALPSLLSN